MLTIFKHIIIEDAKIKRRYTQLESCPHCSPQSAGKQNQTSMQCENKATRAKLGNEIEFEGSKLSRLQ